MKGTLYGLGVGPGDPELITLKALRILERASVLAYPAPEEGESLVRGIVAGHLDGHHEEMCIRMPMVAARFPAREVYDRAAVELGRHLDAGRDRRDAVRRGPPSSTARSCTCSGAWRARHTVEVVPGVSSLMACAATPGSAARRRATTCSRSFRPRSPTRRWERRIRDADAVAVIKVGRHLPRVRAVIEAMGLTANARYVEHATMASEKILPLGDVPEDAAPYFLHDPAPRARRRME